MAHMAVNSQPGLSATWHWAHQNGHDWRVTHPECYICIAQALASEASKAMQGQLDKLSLSVIAGLHCKFDSSVSVKGPQLHWVC